MRWTDWLLVAAGGATGSVLRALLAYGLLNATPKAWPWGTLAANVLGCALLGWLTARGMPPGTRALLAVGLCGGLTTFSTWVAEVVLLQRQHHLGWAVGYGVVTLVAGLGAFWAGRAVS